MKKHQQSGNKLKLVVNSGYFDPLHSGHLAYLNCAKKFGDLLFVIINNDYQANLKKSYVFLPEDTRVDIISNLKSVDFAIKSIDKDRSVIESLKLIHANFSDIADIIFANGGDINADNLREKDICKKLNIAIKFGIGGNSKIQSSSKLIEKVLKK